MRRRCDKDCVVKPYFDNPMCAKPQDNLSSPECDVPFGLVTGQFTLARHTALPLSGRDVFI
jgi:hypothetical protein